MTLLFVQLLVLVINMLILRMFGGCAMYVFFGYAKSIASHTDMIVTGFHMYVQIGSV